MPLDLIIVDAKAGSTQPVPVESAGDGVFRILHSPGFVEGVAAGDSIRLVDDGVGGFDVVARGGNVCVKVFTRGPVEAVRAAIERKLEPLGGFCDGSVSRGAVFMVPARSGFGEIKCVFASAAAAAPGTEWYFGNVFAADGATPLNWCLEMVRQ